MSTVKTRIPRRVPRVNDAEKDLNYAKSLATFDYDRFAIEDVLLSHGYSEEEASDMAIKAVSYLPKGYPQTPPICFQDVKDHILNSLKTYNIESIMFYFKQYANTKYKEITNRIIKIRELGEEGCCDSILEDIKPLVEGLLMDNYALLFRPKDKENVNEIEKRENLELELFGVWTIELIRRRKRIIKIDNRVIKISKGQKTGNTSF